MTYHIGQTREAMTAIAAVLAFSSTPLLAQDPDAADTAVETPPAAPDPLAPAPEAAPDTTESATETAAEPEPAAAPPAPRPKVESARARTSAPARTARTQSSRAARTAARTAAVPATTAVAEVSAEPALPPVADTLPVDEPLAPPPAEAPSIEEQMLEELGPVAGGTALGLLGIGGIAMAMRRRKRRILEEQEEAAKWAIIEAAPDVETQAESEPALARASAPLHDPVPSKAPARADRPAATLPNGPDASNFGRHVQAAYRGPTPDNPSVSLEYRLRKASILDQQEQEAKEAAASAAKVPSKGNWESRTEADFLFRRAGGKNDVEPAVKR